jgi:pimeloyl-ACP methyl ester carboxylesterase
MAATEPKRPRPRWRQRRFAYPVLYTLFFFLMTFGGCADRLILYPSTHPLPRAASVQRREAPLPAGSPVEVWVGRSPGALRAEPRAFALTFTGNADRAERAAAYVAADWGTRPVEVWAVNYPGYGGSPGPARMGSIPPAALAAYDALAARAGGRPIFVTGQSLGTTAALYVAAHRPVAGCVLWSPPPLRNMILLRHGWWNLWLLAAPVALAVPPELDSLRNAPKVTAPAVFVLTGRDTVVPVKYQVKVTDAYAGTRQIVRLGDSEHNAVIEGQSLRDYDAALDAIFDSATRPR